MHLNKSSDSSKEQSLHFSETLGKKNIYHSLSSEGKQGQVTFTI